MFEERDATFASGVLPAGDDRSSVASMARPWDDSERAALVALLRSRPRNMKWPEIAAQVDDRGSALVVWSEEYPADLFAGDEKQPALLEAHKDIALWNENGLGFLTFLDDRYPAQLRDIHDFPPVLFHRGKLVPGETGMSVVGSRAASKRGLDIAGSLADRLVGRGITVLAGLAKGIDSAAHIAALEAGGRTVAIIGTGIRKFYPPDNRALQERIAAEGLVLSQFWPDAPPTKHSFPMRNTVMSGYGRATIVVEAGEHSGARIQARRAVAHGRPVILTDLVVNANKWAREMTEKPGVHVASGTDQAMAIVDDIMSGPARLHELLAVAARA